MGIVRGEGCERHLGYSILELVLLRLRQANFTADVAFPGQKYPQITDTVAAVHIEKVDRANLEVTMEVNIICPASMGGTACEIEALRATEILRWAGAVCIQNGCTYDGVAQVYTVSVLATFTGVTEEDDCIIWPGFYCNINDKMHRFVVSFTSEYTNGAQLEYTMGSAAPVGSCLGTERWVIEMEELIPSGSAEVEEPEGEFELKIILESKKEIYSGCRWTSIRRERTRQGLRRIRKGFALSREEA